MQRDDGLGCFRGMWNAVRLYTVASVFVGIFIAGVYAW